MTDAERSVVRRTLNPNSASIVAYRGRTALDGRALGLVSAAIHKRLTGCTSGEWGIYLDSPFLQLATLIAIQAHGSRALLLPHNQPEFVLQTLTQCDALILEGDHSDSKIRRLPSLEALLEEGARLGELSCDWRHPIGLLTSGSTGAPTRSFKSPPQLIAEIEMLESAFGAAIDPRRTFFGTTSHQHMFGFTFRVMWPFLSGRPIADIQIRIPGEISHALQTHDQIVLISSPAFLERAQQLLDFDELRRTKFIGFSSGSPLGATTAVKFNTQADVTLIEIYGSTETGALASRTTLNISESLWRGLPGVEIETDDGCLSVRAPHLASQGPTRTEDLVDIYPGGFRLKGRRDQIVKVADKRVSITELNRRLVERPDVLEARVVPLSSGVLAAIVVPSNDAWMAIEKLGKSNYCAALRDHLSTFVDRVTTPKRWRLVKQLPRNSLGKIEQGKLTALFDVAPPNPRWKVLEESPQRWVGETTVTADVPELNGHFPGNPIIPGVTQLSWAVGCARKAFLLESVSGSLEAVKFRKPILPGTRIRLTLSLQTSSNKVQFEIRDDDHTYNSGRLIIDHL